MRILLTLWMLTLAALPASAQIDLTGSWRTRMHEDFFERGPGSDLADFTGLPLTDEGRAKGLKYDPTDFAIRERQCLLFSPWAIVYQPLDMRMWAESDADGRIIAWKMSGNVLKDVVTIWMDGRPHPSENAFHPFSGFTTGRWEGDTLTARTTHLKTTELRRGTGIPASDQATITAHITRHDDLLTLMTIEEDPFYLSEPHVITRVFQLEPRQNFPLWNVCMAQTEIPRLEDSGIVPHHLPGENPQEFFLSKTYNIPQDAAMGHAETLYPEYRKKLKATYTAPAQCTRYCCGWLGFEGLPDSAPGLKCIIGGGYGAQDQEILKEIGADNRQKK